MPLKFLAMYLRHLLRWPSVDIQVKFYGDRRGGPVRRLPWVTLKDVIALTAA